MSRSSTLRAWVHARRQRRALDRAAFRYARELGPWLVRAFGASTAFTPAQVRTGITTLDLPRDLAALGYATFLPQALFDTQGSDIPVRLTYAEGRGHVRRHAPPGPVFASWNAPVNNVTFIAGGELGGLGSSNGDI